MYYWMDRHLDVDFIALGPRGEKWAIEVKSSPPSLSELKGVMTFCRDHPDFKPVVVCPQKVNLNGIDFLALKDVLRMSRLTSQMAATK